MNRIASKLSDEYYELCMDGVDTPFSRAVNAYITVMRDEALLIQDSEKHPDLDVTEWMRAFHHNIGQLFYDL